MQQTRDITATNDFLKAAATGDADRLRDAFARGAVVNRSDKNGMTALLYAGQRGDVDMLGYLFSIGADPRAQDDKGDDALMKSIAGGHVDAARFCLTQSFNMSVANAAGMTAFAHAALHGFDMLLDDMRAKGAAADSRSSNGRTPLIHAASAGKTIVIDKILTFDDIAVNTQDDEGRTALMSALVGGHREAAISLLIGGARPDICDNRGRNAMFYAGQWGLQDEINEAFRRYDVGQITEGARHDINVLKPPTIRRRAM